MRGFVAPVIRMRGGLTATIVSLSLLVACSREPTPSQSVHDLGCGVSLDVASLLRRLNIGLVINGDLNGRIFRPTREGDSRFVASSAGSGDVLIAQNMGRPALALAQTAEPQGSRIYANLIVGISGPEFAEDKVMKRLKADGDRWTYYPRDPLSAGGLAPASYVPTSRAYSLYFVQDDNGTPVMVVDANNSVVIAENGYELPDRIVSASDIAKCLSPTTGQGTSEPRK